MSENKMPTGSERGDLFAGQDKPLGMSQKLYWESNAEIKIADEGGEMSLSLYRSGCGHFFTFSDGLNSPPCPICNEFKRYYELLAEAKIQIESDQKEIDRLTADWNDAHAQIDALETRHLASVQSWKAEIENLRGDEAQQRLRAELAERLIGNMGLQAAQDLCNARHEILELRERNMVLAQEKQLILMQFCDDILTLLSEFGYANQEKRYSSPAMALSDLRAIFAKDKTARSDSK